MRYELRSPSPIIAALTELEENRWVVDYKKMSARANVIPSGMPRTMHLRVGFELRPDAQGVMWAFALNGQECALPQVQPFLACLKQRFDDAGFVFIRGTATNVHFQWFVVAQALFAAADADGASLELGVMYRDGLFFTEACIRVLNEYHARVLFPQHASSNLPPPDTLADYCLFGFHGEDQRYNA